MNRGKRITFSLAIVAMAGCTDNTPMAARVAGESLDKRGSIPVPPATSIAAGNNPPSSMIETNPGEVLRRTYYDCLQTAGGNTWLIQDCIAEEFDFQDARLNDAYQKRMQGLTEDAKHKFKHAQRKWLADLKHECKWDADTEGQAQRLQANICSLKATAIRAFEIDSLMSGADGE